MSKRGRRRSSRRRKSSSSSKQSSSTFLFQNQSNCPTVSCKKDTAEMYGENSLKKENMLSRFEEQQHDHAPSIQKRCKQDFNMAASQEQRSIYTKTNEVEEKGVKIVMSVSINDMEKTSQKVQIQHGFSHVTPCENPPNLSTPVTNIFNFHCSGSNVKVEIQETQQGNPYGMKTTRVFLNDNEGSEMIINGEHEKAQIPDHEPLEKQPENVTSHNVNKETNYRLMSEQRKDQRDSRSACSSNLRGDPSYCRCCNDFVQQNLAKHLFRSPLLMDINAQGKQPGTFGRDQFFPISTLENITCSTLEDLTNDLACFKIGGQSESVSPFSVLEKEREDARRSFDQLSESDNYEPMYLSPSMSTNRSSFTKDFIYCQKRKSWIRNNSIAAVEHKEYLLLRKRRQTFPGTSLSPELIHEDVPLPYKESISSFLMCSFPFQTERLEKSKQYNDRFSTYMRKKYDSSQSRESSKTYSDNSETNEEFTGNELDKEMSPEVYVEEIIQGGLAIQVIPPSRSGSEEQILQTDPREFAKNKDENGFTQSDSDQALSKLSKCQVISEAFDNRQRNIMYISTSEETDIDTVENNIAMKNESNLTERSVTSLPLLPMTDEHYNKLPIERSSDDLNKAVDDLLCTVKPPSDILFNSMELPIKTGKAEKPIVCRSNSEAKEHLKPGTHKDRDGTDHWARKRKLFKDSKQWSSTGGSSMTSDMTEESVSEDTVSTHVAVQDNDKRGFYAETFHSSAWIYQGDSVGSGAIGANLAGRTPAVSIRERTVQISKGTGEYPWGFRIQFSKPIVVTEVDTNGSAEEAGLIVSDYVLAVNGIDVTSIAHSEAANLARQGPNILTLTTGSDIARSPNTPRPPCRGYLHKRTQSGLIKGWRKRWFVLKHDSCLYYYKNKRDEGKRQPLSSVKLEGAEVGPDDSLGKPFVFKCRPQFGSRVYSLCATSNQEMKRWCEALERAIHPITQNHVWIDVTRHNSNMPPLAVKNPDCLGLLNKMDKSKDTWVKHYCILKDACLYLYSGIRATHAHGGIYLQGYTVREQAYGSKKSTIELKPPSDEFKTFYFCAENSAENERWILAIKSSMKKWRPFHLVLQDYMSLPPEETRM